MTGTGDQALLVGINAYPNGNQLEGCVNDITNIKGYLIQELGFSPANIVVLLDGAATASSIKAALATLCAGAAAGNRRYFHYSGHGAQMVDGDASTDCICPVDFDWSPAHAITSADFAAILGRMPPGVLFNWASDSCHSGDLEGIKKSLARNPHKVTPKVFPHPPHVLAGLAAARSRAPHRSLTNGILDVGFISGCRSDQTSADTAMNGTPCGAFTYFYVDALRRMPKATIFNDLGAGIGTALTQAGYEQQPETGGTRATKPLLQ